MGWSPGFPTETLWRTHIGEAVRWRARCCLLLLLLLPQCEPQPRVMLRFSTPPIYADLCSASWLAQALRHPFNPQISGKTHTLSLFLREYLTRISHLSNLWSGHTGCPTSVTRHVRCVTLWGTRPGCILRRPGKGPPWCILLLVACTPSAHTWERPTSSNTQASSGHSVAHPLATPLKCCTGAVLGAGAANSSAFGAW